MRYNDTDLKDVGSMKIQRTFLNIIKRYILYQTIENLENFEILEILENLEKT